MSDIEFEIAIGQPVSGLAWWPNKLEIKVWSCYESSQETNCINNKISMDGYLSVKWTLNRELQFPYQIERCSVVVVS